jgi:5-hydroxyisourate hydrolase
MSRISTHVLDTVLGKPAAGIAVRLDLRTTEGWHTITSSVTDADGRVKALSEDASRGIYRLAFMTAPYFELQRRSSIYPEVVLTFQCDGATHYHLPLLLSDNSYTTYRGS